MTDPAADDEHEVPLAGGNFGPVVRVGDTVRRGTGPWTPAVHALLEHLAGVGFDAAPRVLGTDGRGREVLTYLDGDAGVPPFPPAMLTDDAVVATGALIRRYHEAVAGFVPPPGAVWRVLPGAPTDGPIICHVDLAPYNTIYDERRPIAFIDWDFAAPGTPLWDLGYAAWRFVPLTNDRDRPELGWPPGLDLASRLRAFCEGYGLTAADRGRLLDHVEARQICLRDAIRSWAADGVSGFATALAEGHDVGIDRDIDFLHESRRKWSRALR